MPREKKQIFNSYPFEYHEEINLKIDTLTHEGHGLGKINNWVVMVKFTLPGEVIKARIFKNHKNYSEGDLVEIITPAANRTSPKCKLFTKCGGCQYQHLTYADQLLWKQNHVQTLFDHQLKTHIPVLPTISSPNTYHYRSKITPHYQKAQLPIGFLKTGSTRHLIDVDTCPIATAPINDQLKIARQQFIENPPKKSKGGTLLFRDTGKAVETNPRALITMTVGDHRFSCIAGEFFQNNPHILPIFLDYIGAQIHSTEIDYLIDAYCGVGLFSIYLNKNFKAFAGVEINPQATQLAIENAKMNHIENGTFIQGQAEAIFHHITFPANKTVILLDPPRKGCDQIFLEQLIQYRPKQIIYVACDPATQARDAKYLQDNGYQIKSIQPFDFFPQTKHIENVILLENSKIE